MTSGGRATRTAQERAAARREDAAAVKALVGYIEAEWQQWCGPLGRARAAFDGDATAVRSLLESFLDHCSDGRIVPAVGDRVSEAHESLVLTTRIVRKMLDQPEDAFIAALGYQGRRRVDADRRRQAVAKAAVDEAMYGMGVVRSRRTAVDLVVEAMARVPHIFSTVPLADTVEKWSRKDFDEDAGLPDG